MLISTAPLHDIYSKALPSSPSAEDKMVQLVSLLPGHRPQKEAIPSRCLPINEKVFGNIYKKTNCYMIIRYLMN